MAIPGMFSGLAAGQQPQQGGMQLDEEQKRRLVQMLMQQRPQQGGQPQQPARAPGAPATGMFSGMMPGQQPQAQPQAPQQQAVPGAATPEQAAADRAQMLRKAGASVGQPQTQQTGMFTPIGSRSAAGNIFSGDKQWFSGLFDTTERTSPFDSFFVNNQSSQYWL